MNSIILKIMSLMMSLLAMLGQVATPSADNAIHQYNKAKVMSFYFTGDPQVAAAIPSREAAVIAAVKDWCAAETTVDAMVCVGDIAENGLLPEYEAIYNDFKDVPVKNWIFATGNHDIRMREYSETVAQFTAFQNQFNDAKHAIKALHYSYTVKGYKFIVMGSDITKFEDAFFTNAQLEWLDSELQSATQGGKPAFVLLHQPLKHTHGLPNTWGSSIGDKEILGSVGEQSDTILEILDKYQNVILLTGHLHTGFGQYTYEKIGNNIHGVNVPSLGIENKDGKYNNNGTGFYVEVMPTKVVFHARDFAKGVNINDQDITVPLV